eukprot:7113014-Prymnesium_polylepis.2
MSSATVRRLLERSNAAPAFSVGTWPSPGTPDRATRLTVSLRLCVLGRLLCQPRVRLRHRVRTFCYRTGRYIVVDRSALSPPLDTISWPRLTGACATVAQTAGPTF